MPSERVQRRIESLLDQAEEASESRDWKTVLELTAGVLDADPEHEDALTFRGMADASMRESDAPTSTAVQEAPASSVADEIDTPTSFANGRYEVTGFLGEGGKKKVYLCRDTTLDRDVAFSLIKAEGLDDQARQRVTREAQAMARLGDHPNLMPVFDMGQENGLPFLVQPYMSGGSVEDLVDGIDGNSLSLERSLEVAQQVLSGLQFAHERGIIHRDLKPGNIWLADDGSARIGDFGLALTLDRSRLTQESMMIGTVSYMPPEQATGGEATPQSDLYSLGCMLYESPERHAAAWSSSTVMTSSIVT